MNRILCSILLITIQIGCNDPDSSPEENVVPDNLSLDINNDGIIDFEILYFKQDEAFPVDPGGILEVVRCKFITLNNNLVLTKSIEATSTTSAKNSLFITDTNSILLNASSPYSWNQFDFETSKNTILYIRQNFDEVTWQSEWSIINSEIMESYFIGFNLSSNNMNQLGWIELSIDQQTGLINILNIELL